jgi:hypothetical protein
VSSVSEEPVLGEGLSLYPFDPFVDNSIKVEFRA